MPPDWTIRGYNFWTVRDRDFIFGMNSQLIMTSNDTKVNDIDFDLYAKNRFADFVVRGV